MEKKNGDRTEGHMQKIRRVCPRIHCITNYVTAQSVANIVLAAGASPIMASGVHEVEDVTGICDALVINIGTLDERTIPSMILAGKKAAELGHAIVFDPVGVGASAFRRETALRILAEVPVTVVRGNGSEIRILLETELKQKTEKAVAEQTDGCGIDASESDLAKSENAESKAEIAAKLAIQQQCIVVMTGEVDIVTDGRQLCMIENGHPWMGRITGSGCMLDGILAAFLAACSKTFSERLAASAWAVAAHGICGEMAYEKTAAQSGGTGSFYCFFMDAMSLLEDETLEERAKILWTERAVTRKMEKVEKNGNTEIRKETERERSVWIRRSLCLYAVTDPHFSKDDEEFLAQIEAAIQGGASMVQLREKELEDAAFLRRACKVRDLTEKYKVPLIINDNIEVALACGADGVHMGQGDMPAEEARKRLGDSKILGVTAKTVEQAQAAYRAGADYLGSGAMFGSVTKQDAKYMNFETLQAICQSVPISVVAIGGINKDNVEQLAGSGMAGAAVVSGIFGKRTCEHIRAAARDLREKVEKIL